MIYSNLITFEVCLVKKAHTLANNFANKQKDVSKARQVYHNSLAVWAVNYYMKCMEIETNWEMSNSWNVITQSLLNVADLVLPEIGKLECRPIMEDEQSVYIPFDVSQERLAYVIVQLDSSLKKAVILGFIKAVATEEFSINKLQSLKELLLLIEQTKLRNLENVTIQLSKWLELPNKFENEWLPYSVLFKNSLREDLASSLRGTKSLTADPNKSLVTATRGKKIDLGIQVDKNQVALVITLAPGENENINILAQVYAIHSLHLPAGLELVIIDETEQPFLQAEAREKDQLIQLEFFGSPGERFSIKLALQENSIIKHFII